MSIELQKEARQAAIVSIDNQAVADGQERMQMRVSELDIEIHEDEFAYGPRHEKQRKPR